MKAADSSFAKHAPAQFASRHAGWGALLLLAALSLAYGRTFEVPFRFDDNSSILTNESIRQLWPPWTMFSPPAAVTVTGRPLVNFSLALNYAISGFAPWSYHALNLAIHAGAALLLAGIVRRTLLTDLLRPRWERQAERIGWAAAACWALHPLQTESVTYVIQRAEALMALGYLAALYCFIRAMTENSRGWQLVAVLATWAAVAAKEVAVSIPLVVLCYDRTFVAGSFGEAWRRRRMFLVALASSWLLLGWLIARTEGRSGSAGFATDMSPWHYLLTQAQAIWIYLKLSVWPHPLVFDYGTDVVTRVADVWRDGAGVLLLMGGTIWALVKRPVAGFFGAVFFLLLAPTTSFVPVATQTMAEHRMYLPLAAVVTAGVAASWPRVGRRSSGIFFVVVAVFGVLTWQRNEVYRDELALWTQTVLQRPGNARAHYNLAVVLAERGRPAEAIASYETALKLDPSFPQAHANLGALLIKFGRGNEGLAHDEIAVRLEPDNAELRNHYGRALAEAGRIGEALPQWQESVRLKPDYPQARANLGSALLQLDRTDDAILHLEEAVRLEPKLVEARSNLGLAFLQKGRLADAARQYEALLQITPDDITALNNLGYIALQSGSPERAIQHYARVAQLSPGNAQAHFNLGVAYLRAHRDDEAAAAFARALQAQPNYPEARRELARLRKE